MADPTILHSHAHHTLTDQVQAVWDEEGPDGIADIIRGLSPAAGPPATLSTPDDGDEPPRSPAGPPTVADSATPKPQRVADLTRDQRTDLIAAAIANAAECAAIDVTVTEDDGTEAPLRRLARCLGGAGLIDWKGL